MVKRIIKQIETPISLVDYIIEQLGDIGGGGGSSQQYIDGEVEYHEDLPTGIGNPATNTAYLVRKGQGVWLINRKPAGIWVRETDNGNLNDWVYAGSFPDVYNDANFRIYDNDDSSKNLAFNLDNLNSNTTVTLTIPSSGGTVITSNDTGVFYPRNNPSGFITGVAGLDLSSYVTGSVVRPEETGNFYTNNNPSGFISQDLGTNGQLLVSNNAYSDEVGIITNADEVLVVKMGDGSFQYGGGYPGAAPISILSGSTQLPVIGIYDLPNSDYNEITWNDSLLTLRNYPDGIGNLGLGGNVQLIYNFGNDESDSVRTIAVDERVVHNFGNETISGIKDFAIQPTVNGTGVVLSNEISKIIDKFTVSSNQPPAERFATLDTKSSILVLDYDDAVTESGTFIGMIPETAGTITGLRVRILWSATTATSGNCRWGARFADLSSSGINAPFDLGTEVNSTANSVSGMLSTADIVCSGTAGLAANEFYRLVIYRNSEDTINDTMAGDAELISATTYLI